jgi:hypothetical protein
VLNNKKVVVFTPFGRELTASLLYEYLKRDHAKGIVDEWHLWLNMDKEQVDDAKYAEKLDEENDWIKRIQLAERPYHPKQLNTGLFYKFAQDKDTIYVRMDDDIVWIEEDAIKRLVEARISNPFPFVVFPIIWNNAVCSHYLQLGEQLPGWWGAVGNYCMDPTGWADPFFAENIHKHLLMCIEKDLVDQLYFHTSIQLQMGQQLSVSCFAQFGEEYAKVNGDLGNLTVVEEEGWHTMSKPYELGRPNLIVPNSLISHFSFYHQRSYLLGQTNILERYKELADSVNS